MPSQWLVFHSDLLLQYHMDAVSVSLHRPFYQSPFLCCSDNSYGSRWHALKNKHSTIHFFAKKKQYFSPFCRQSSTYPSTSVFCAPTNPQLFLPMASSVQTELSALLHWPLARWLFRASCLCLLSLVKYPFFVLGLPLSAKMLLFLRGLSYTGCVFFLTFFHKVDKFRSSLFFTGFLIFLYKVSANTSSTLSCLQAYLPSFKLLTMRLVYFPNWQVFRRIRTSGHRWNPMFQGSWDVG